MTAARRSRFLAVELFSGTAGATAVFRKRDDWTVVTVDVDGRHKPSIVADVRALPLSLGPDVERPVELLWCSPTLHGVFRRESGRAVHNA